MKDEASAIIKKALQIRRSNCDPMYHEGSIRWFAKELDISYTSASEIVRGKKFISFEMLDKIRKVLPEIDGMLI